MKTLKIVIFCMILSLLYVFFPFGHSVLFAEKVENKRWSFDLKDCTVLDALRKINNITNIEILTNRNGDKEIPSKSYKDQTIDQILRDLFRKENCAMIWSYGDNGLASIDILVFKGGGSGGSARQERFAKQDGAKLQGNRVKKTADFKSKVPMKKSPKIEKNDLFPPLSKPKGYATADARYSKLQTMDDNSKSDNLVRTILDAKKSPAVQLTNGTLPPTLEKRHGLEPPPMPPGFSN